MVIRGPTCDVNAHIVVTGGQYDHLFSSIRALIVWLKNGTKMTIMVTLSKCLELGQRYWFFWNKSISFFKFNSNLSLQKTLIASLHLLWCITIPQPIFVSNFSVRVNPPCAAQTNNSIVWCLLLSLNLYQWPTDDRANNTRCKWKTKKDEKRQFSNFICYHSFRISQLPSLMKNLMRLLLEVGLFYYLI